MNVIVQLGTTVVASAASPSSSVAFARMQQPHSMQKVAVVTVPKPCTVVEPLVQTIKTEDVQSEEMMDVKVKVEELLEDMKPTYHSPLDHATTKEQRLEILKLVLQDHNYVASPVAELTPSTHGPSIAASSYSGSTSMYPYGGNNEDDDANSVISSGTGREVEPEGEETETAPEGEGDDDDSVTRCICDFQHDDGYMICCDKCFVWQHVDCMQIDRGNIPELYSCERCQPRKVDKQRARALQMRKREELFHVDSSTDSSSSSSPDCAATVRSSGSNVVKKRSPTVPVPAATTARRKSEPAPSSSSSKTCSKKSVASKQSPAPLPPPPPLRQRRESNSKEQRKVSVSRRKESKRMPVRRKSKSRTVVSDSDEDSDMEKPSSVQELRQWIEHYEEAVTNHYSPELRARISSIKVNGIHSDLRVASLPVTPKCRTTILGSGLRILYAAVNLPSNQPVIELRGKYMLSVQHHASVSMQNSRRVRLPPGPYIFFYRLPKDGTEVCVDTSTYGNDARFVRRSCRPNAELRHCIEKGTLHLYLVTLCKVERGAEITIAHDSSQENLTPVSCACSNPDECLAFSRKNGIHDQISDRERRRRVRRTSTNDGDGHGSQLPSPAPVSPSKQSAPMTRRSCAARSPVKQAPPQRPVTPPVEEPSNAVASNDRFHHVKTDLTAALNNVITTTTVTATTATTPTTTTTTATTCTTSSAAVVTTLERNAGPSNSTTSTISSCSKSSSTILTNTTIPVVTTASTTTATTSSVNTTATTSSSSSTNTTHTTSTTSISSNTTTSCSNTTTTSTTTITTTTTATTTTTTTSSPSATASTSSAVTPPADESNKKLSREDRKMAAILKAIERMEQQSQKKEGSQIKHTHRKEVEPVKKPEPKPEVKPDTPKKEVKKTAADRPRRKRRRGRTRTNSTSTRRCRRDSVDSEGSSGDEGPPGPSSPPQEESQEQSTSPGHGLSTAAGLLLALANATTPQQNPPSSYRPHTPPTLDKLNSETLGGVNPTLFCQVCDSAGGNSSHGSTPPTPLSSACLLVAAAVDNLAPGFKFPKTKKGLMNEWLNQPPTPPDIMVDSALALSHNKCLVQGQGASHTKVGSGSAKKRWLRQAISEEGETGGSPNSRAESPPGSDCVPPLKKRRLARESMSSEQSVTPPSTPTQAVDSFSLKDGEIPPASTTLPSICEEDDDEEVDEAADGSDEVEVLQVLSRVIPPAVDEDNSNGTEEDVCRGFEQAESVPPVSEPPSLPEPSLPLTSVAPSIPLEEEEDEESESESALSATAQPAKRKLSISEYWQRKQRGSCSEPMKTDEDVPETDSDKKQVNHSSSSSSLSSDDETENSSPALTNLPIFNTLDAAEDKKGGEDLNYMKWNSAPTMVEQQRENLTERLRREFGLFLSDDEEQERARKQQSQNAETAVKETKKRAPPPPPPPHPPPPETVQPQSYQAGQKFCHNYASPHVGYGYPAYTMMGTSQSGFTGHQPPPPPPPPLPSGRFSGSKKPYLLPTPPGNPVYNSHAVYSSGSGGPGRPGAQNSSAFLTAAAAKAYFPANHP